MFDTEFQFFVENQSELVRRHGGKFLVLHGKEVAGVFDDALGAYTAAKRKFTPGTFMIQHCVPGAEAYTLSISPANAVV